MTASYFQTEIRELASFPGMNAAAVLDALNAAGRDLTKLETIYKQLLEETYGDQF